MATDPHHPETPSPVHDDPDRLHPARPGPDPPHPRRIQAPAPSLAPDLHGQIGPPAAAPALHGPRDFVLVHATGNPQLFDELLDREVARDQEGRVWEGLRGGGLPGHVAVGGDVDDGVGFGVKLANAGGDGRGGCGGGGGVI